MKIYHTETQADYDALMIDLEKRGNETLPEDYWSVFETATTVIVRTKSEEISERKKGTTYFDLGRICSRYPGVPITEYKAAVQEMKLRESGSVRYINTVYLPRCDYCNSNILEVEKYYFVAIEGNELTDVRIVHRECFNRSRVGVIEEETE